MALTFAEAKVLATLHRSDKALAMRELRARAGLSDHGARSAMRELICRGLASSTDKIPAYYRPTDRGRSVVQQSVYREFLAPPSLTTTSVEGR